MAWAEPVSSYADVDVKSKTVQIEKKGKKSNANGKNESLKGTLYNQFYKPNPEAAPMKPLPRNLDK